MQNNNKRINCMLNNKYAFVICINNHTYTNSNPVEESAGGTHSSFFYV